MSLQWTLVATFLYAEIGLIILLLLPFISPQRWQKVFKSRVVNSIEKNVNIYFTVFLGILGLLFADSIREVRRYESEHGELDVNAMPSADVTLHMKLFRAQRNFYIAGMALFLWLVIKKMVTLISTQARLEASSDAAMKQAKSASEVANRLLDDQNKGTSSEDRTNAENEALEKIQNELTRARKELRQSELNLETMKSQAEATNQEYDRLMEEHEKLQKKMNILEGGGEGDKKSD